MFIKNFWEKCFMRSEKKKMENIEEKPPKRKKE